MEIFHILFYVPTFNLLMVFYGFVGNLGVAILILAVISRLITWPLTQRQIKNAEKGKDFQKEVDSIKKKYEKNKEKQASELAKVQAKYLPGQLGGCLNLIIALILLVQVRNVIINLVDQGVHAFNQVAYTEAQKLPEDSITTDLSKLPVGVYDLEYEIVSGDSQLNKVYTFAIVNDDTRGELSAQLDQRLAEITPEQREEQEKLQRQSSIALYIEELQDYKDGDPIVIDDPRPVTAFIRPPSRQTIDYEESSVIINSEVVPADQLIISKGVPLNFTFLGADLSKVATDFGFTDIKTVAPYVIIAVLVGVTQLFASRVQMGLNPSMSATPSKDDKKKDKDKKGKGKDKKPEDVSFTELLTQSSKQMTYLFPAITVVWSLGFFGAFFPTGVSLFWTGQNGFVIIQELITKRKKVKASVSEMKGKLTGSKSKDVNDKEVVKLKVSDPKDNGKKRKGKKNN